jgi:hypothetical protein
VKGILGGEVCSLIPCATGPGNDQTTAGPTATAPGGSGPTTAGGPSGRGGDDLVDLVRRLLEA